MARFLEPADIGLMARTDIDRFNTEHGSGKVFHNSADVADMFGFKAVAGLHRSTTPSIKNHGFEPYSCSPRAFPDDRLQRGAVPEKSLSAKP